MKCETCGVWCNGLVGLVLHVQDYHPPPPSDRTYRRESLRDLKHGRHARRAA